MQPQQYLLRQCPCCGSNIKSDAQVFSEKRAEDLSYEELTPYWNGFFKDKIFFSYKACEKCQMLYAPIFYNASQLEALYAQMAPNMDIVPLSALENTQRSYFDHLKQSAELTGGFIEIGPDIGLFTQHCVSEGHFDHYWLFEPNLAVHTELSGRMKNSKISIIDSMFGFSQVPDHSVNVAVMIQVLDHLLDPVATLVELRKKLRPGAKLLLVTHNEQSLLRKIVGTKWPAFCLQHPQIYNPKTITALLERAGYEVNSIDRSKNYFEFGFLLKHLLWAFGIKVNSLPAFLNFTIPLKLGNMMTIAAPKTRY